MLFPRNVCGPSVGVASRRTFRGSVARHHDSLRSAMLVPTRGAHGGLSMTGTRGLWQHHSPTSSPSPLHLPPCEVAPLTAAPSGGLQVSYTPGSGVSGDALTVPTTALTGHCDVLAESVSKAEELQLHQKAQAALGAGSELLTEEGIEEMMQELQEVTTSEVEMLLESVKGGAMQQAGMHELRRTLYYTTSLQARGWLEEATYTTLMRALTVEILHRDNNGVLSPNDVLYVTTQMIAANFYNRHLWNRMEKSLEKVTNFETIDLPTIKALTTKLFRTRRGCSRETLDVRRKILNAMSRRVSILANDFELPALLGILQCYTVHDMSPFNLEPLVIRSTNHLQEFTPQECASLVHVLRKFRLMRLEVCERLLERICTSEQLNHHMASSALTAIRICYGKVSDGGRHALHAEPTKQKLRALGEQVGCRLDEVQFPAMRAILYALDVIVQLKIYVPKKPLQSMFAQAHAMIVVVMEHEDELVDPSTGKHVRPITMEEGRQLQALLLQYGSELCPELLERLRTAFREGTLPDEGSL